MPLTMGARLGPYEVIAPVGAEEHALHAEIPGGRHVHLVVVDEDALAGSEAEAAAGQVEDGGLGLGHANLGRADDVVEEMADADLVLESPPQRGVGIAQDGDLVPRPEGHHQRDVRLDGSLALAPLLVQRWQRTPRSRLERPVRLASPRVGIPAATLDGAPRLRAVQRLEHRGSRQAVRPVQLAGDIPAHVPQDAAEVEDDGAEASSEGHGGPAPAWARWPARDRR